MMRFIFLSFILTSLFLLTSCGNQAENQLEEDRALIEAYLAENNLTAEVTPEGVYYIIEKQGNGDYPTSTSQVSVDYHGYLLDGSTFDQGFATFSLTGVIAGWTIGIPLFDKGAEGMLLIPSSLGYGRSGNSTIEGNTVLLFDIKLVDF